nr:hypothetical protein [Desulfonatronum thioautotrophicum]
MTNLETGRDEVQVRIACRTDQGVHLLVGFEQLLGLHLRVRLDVQIERGRALGIQVPDQRPPSLLGAKIREIDRGRGLSDTAFHVVNCKADHAALLVL